MMQLAEDWNHCDTAELLRPAKIRSIFMQREMMSVANLNSGGNRGLKQAMVVPVPPQNSIRRKRRIFAPRHPPYEFPCSALKIPC